MRSVLVLALALSACTSGEGATPTDYAFKMCRAVAGADESVVFAHPTTVGQVRNRRGGLIPPPDWPPLKLWDGLPNKARAAWCTYHSDKQKHYVVAAAAQGGRRQGFMVTGSGFDPGTDGPAIP